MSEGPECHRPASSIHHLPLAGALPHRHASEEKSPTFKSSLARDSTSLATSACPSKQSWKVSSVAALWCTWDIGRFNILHTVLVVAVSVKSRLAENRRRKKVGIRKISAPGPPDLIDRPGVFIRSCPSSRTGPKVYTTIIISAHGSWIPHCTCS